MPGKASKLLEGMRLSQTKWKRNDLVSLYTGYGFLIDTSKKNHDKVWHPGYPELVTFLPRHKKLGQYLFRDAVKLVDRLVELQKKEEQDV
jgi:hypothetical protein